MPEIYSSSPAYLAAVENEIDSSVLVYLNGEYSVLSREVLLHLVAEEEYVPPGEDPENSVRETKLVYLDGSPFESPEILTNTQSLYMAGGGFRSNKLSYIVATTFENESMLAFISGTDQSGPKEAIRFDSNLQQYVQINDITQYDDLTKFTLNLYVRPRTDSDGRYQGIVVKEGVIETWVHPSGNSFGMRANISGVWYQALTLSFTKDKWHMLTIKHDGVGIKFFMNGIEFLGTNAPGILTSNNAPIYFGRYPSKGTYSDIDLCDVRLWNYDLTNAEIAAMYIPQSRRSCQHAYLCVNEMTQLTSLKRCYIVSASAPNNPFYVRSSQPAGFAEQATYGSQSAFIVAGGETTTPFDTRIVYDLKDYVSFDTVIMVRGNQDRLNEIQLGDIVYPITRYARKIVRIPTSYDPLKEYYNQPCHVVGANDLYVAHLAHVVGITLAKVVKFAFISGPNTGLTDNTAAFIVNNESQGTQAAYINGYHVFNFNWSVPAMVLGFSDNVSATTPAYIAGAIANTITLGCYIKAPEYLPSSRSAFIMSFTNELNSARGLFLGGAVALVRGKNAYMFGHFSAVQSQPAYIVALSTVSDSVDCFIWAPGIIKPSNRAYVRGYELQTLSKLAYIKSDINEQDTQPCYVQGIQSNTRAIRAHVNGPIHTAMGGTITSFVVNYEPVATKHCYIVSDPLTFTRCYINSSGDVSRVKSAYINA